MGIETIDAGSLYLQNARYDLLSNQAARGSGMSRSPSTPAPHEAFDKILKNLVSGEGENRSIPETTRAGGAVSARPGGKPVIDKSSELYEQCEALETFLVKNLLTGMRNTVQKSGLVNEGFAGKMYEDMLYDEYAKDFTKNAGFGLAELAYLELSGQRGKIIANHA
jgi:flagellar protein FlgJ